MTAVTPSRGAAAEPFGPAGGWGAKTLFDQEICAVADKSLAKRAGKMKEIDFAMLSTRTAS